MVLAYALAKKIVEKLNILNTSKLHPKLDTMKYVNLCPSCPTSCAIFKPDSSRCCIQLCLFEERT